jgi:dihydrodipicolinate synthase/N-acetylneuraminate lyase
MEIKTMRGVFPILITPFDEKGRIDEDSMRRLIDFNVEAGVHGLGIANGSEVFKLSEAERVQVTQIVVDQVAGRVPVVINTGAAATDLAVSYSMMAEQNGADALMAMPPSFRPAGPTEVLEYFQAISDAVGIPIFIQDTPEAIVSPALSRRIAESCEWVRYIKVESSPVAEKVADMVAEAGDQLIVFGGAGGNFFIEEMRRGSVGTMPFCTQPEAFVEVWNLCQKGDEEAAREVFMRQILPVNRISGLQRIVHHEVNKEILRQRGIIRTAKVRSPAPTMNDMTRQDLQQVIDRLYP